jgi:hypothetical protein
MNTPGRSQDRRCSMRREQCKNNVDCIEAFFSYQSDFDSRETMSMKTRKVEGGPWVSAEAIHARLSMIPPIRNAIHAVLYPKADNGNSSPSTPCH